MNTLIYEYAEIKLINFTLILFSYIFVNWTAFVQIVKVKKDLIGYLCTVPNKKINEI